MDVAVKVVISCQVLLLQQVIVVSVRLTASPALLHLTALHVSTLMLKWLVMRVFVKLHIMEVLPVIIQVLAFLARLDARLALRRLASLVMILMRRRVAVIANAKLGISEVLLVAYRVLRVILVLLSALFVIRRPHALNVLTNMPNL
jgi:hypothetical protein